MIFLSIEAFQNVRDCSIYKCLLWRRLALRESRPRRVPVALYFHIVSDWVNLDLRGGGVTSTHEDLQYSLFLLQTCVIKEFETSARCPQNHLYMS